MYAFVDTHAHRDAIPWYRQAAYEPVGRAERVRIDSVHPVTHMTLETLLEAILRTARPRSEILVVCHGLNIGLALPLSRRVRTKMRWDWIGSLASDRAEGISYAVPDADVARMMGCNATDIALVRALMNRVRALGLRGVHFRACNVGAQASYLANAKSFFGAQRVSGPRLRDTYGHFGVSQPPPNFDAWVHAHAPTHSRNRWQTGKSPDRMAFDVTRAGAQDHSYELTVVPEGATALATWSQSALGRVITGRRIIYHGLYFTDAPSGSKSVAFVGGLTFARNIELMT